LLELLLAHHHLVKNHPLVLVVVVLVELNSLVPLAEI
jgi:hypothetical protein